MHTKFLVIFMYCLLTLAVCGCAERGPELVIVRGKVLDSVGKPVFPGSIWFVSDSASPSVNGSALDASSLLYEDGRFTLRTYPHGDGAMVGRYRVTLSLGAGSSPSLAKYASPKTTPLTVDVPKEGLQDLALRLDSSQSQERGHPAAKRRTR